MEDNNKKKFAYLVGQFVGGVLVTCIGVCLSGIAIGLTLRFLMWIF